MTYEEYYGLDDFIVDMGERKQVNPGKMPFEEFVKKAASDNIFDNDVSQTCY